ncbi:hypothetical protein RJ641_016048 [Dillenia turbinata]|uniref:Uncharacterized protein n=1 Tax=Dillenia turbinata TaxID=194707 RepID=A0AAN8YYR3_9MAGN
MVNFTSKDIETKIHMAKINQGNIALKRDFFEYAKSKNLMILCESPDPKELHKPISILEHCAKAKGIVHDTQTPVKDKARGEDFFFAVMLGSRVTAMDQFIMKLQMENKFKEREHNEVHKKLLEKEEDVASLRAKLELMEGRGSETNDMEDWSLQ